MKKRVDCWLSILLGMLCLLWCSCCAPNDRGSFAVEAKVTNEVGIVAIFVEDVTGEVMLSAVMQVLQEEGELSYSFDGTGMLTQLNGVSNAADWSACWMLYLDDAELADTHYAKSWRGKSYGSSPVGAAQLPVKSGCTYLWSYDAF